MKTQKIIEAEANLQSAKALNAIAELNTALIDFYAIYRTDLDEAEKDLEVLLAFFDFFAQKNRGRWTNHDDKTKKVIQSVLNITKGLRNYDMQKNCKPKLKLVEDIVSGIKLRSKYEQDIAILNAKLERARLLFTELKKSNDSMRSATAGLLDAEEKEQRKGYLNTASMHKFDDVIDRMMINYIPKVKCNTDSETPF